jgi:hypothetical protein
MSTTTIARSTTITLIDLRSKEIDLADSRESKSWMYDYKTVRILSRGALPPQAIDNVIKQHPGYVCIGVANYPYADEF